MPPPDQHRGDAVDDASPPGPDSPPDPAEHYIEGPGAAPRRADGSATVDPGQEPRDTTGSPREPDATREGGDPGDDESGVSADPRPTHATSAQAPPNLLKHSPFAVGFFATAGGLVAFFLLRELMSISGMLILLVISLFLAIGLNPLVEALMRRGAKRGLAVAGVLGLVGGVFTLFVLTIAPVISDQITLIATSAPEWLERLQTEDSIQRLDDRFDLLDRAREFLAEGDVGGLFGGVLGFGLRVLSAITNAVIVLVLTVYFLASLPSIKAAGYRFAPASRRRRVEELGDRVIRSTGSYVSGAFLVGIFAGVSTLVFTFVVGLREYSFALAFIVGLLSLIPVVGAVISAVIITLIGLTVSPTVALICIVYYMGYQQLEQYVIYPRIMARAVDLPGTVTVVAALVGGSLLGITGALLAVPTAAALLILHKEIFLERQDHR